MASVTSIPYMVAMVNVKVLDLVSNCGTEKFVLNFDFEGLRFFFFFICPNIFTFAKTYQAQ